MKTIRKQNLIPAALVVESGDADRRRPFANVPPGATDHPASAALGDGSATGGNGSRQEVCTFCIPSQGFKD